LLNIPTHLEKAGQQVGRLGAKRDREPKQSFDPDLPSVMLDQVNLRAV
jgi:hypothetical protein